MAAVTLEGPIGKKKVYRVRWRCNGKRPRKSLGSVTADEANRRRDEIEETLRMIDDGRLEIPPRADETEFVFSGGRVEQSRRATQRTIQDCIDAYLESRQVGADTYDEYERRLRTVRDALGEPSRTLDSITIQDLQAFLASRQTKVSGDTAKRDLVRFLDAYKLAAASGWIAKPLNRDDVLTIVTPTIARKKKKPDWRTYQETLREITRRGLTDEETAELWERAYFDATELSQFLDDLKPACAPAPDFLYPMVVTAMFTGARRGELCRLRTQDVDFENGIITLRQRKAHKKKYSESERVVPIHGRLEDVLGAWMLQHGGMCEELFYAPGQLAHSRCQKIDGPRPASRNMATNHLDRVVGKMDAWKHVSGRWHIFRHSFISWCAVAGVPEGDIESWVGHLTAEMRKHYTHLSIDRKKSQMDRLSLPDDSGQAVIAD